MTYAIFTPVYGIPLNSNDRDQVERSEELADMIDGEVPGIIAKYSGSGDMPLAFGIEVGKEFDECAHHIEVSAVTLTATPEQVSDFDHLYAGLSDEVKEELKPFGPARVFLLVSSS